MKKQRASGRFISPEEIGGLERVDTEVKEKIKTLSPESRENIAIANAAFDEINNDVFDFASEARVRNAGFLPSEAEELAVIIKSKQIGQVFQYNKQFLILTPFKTVVPAQMYVNSIQDSLISTSTALEKFTSLSFFGLIKLAFKRLLNNGENNG